MCQERKIQQQIIQKEGRGIKDCSRLDAKNKKGGGGGLPQTLAEEEFVEKGDCQIVTKLVKAVFSALS